MAISQSLPLSYQPASALQLDRHRNHAAHHTTQAIYRIVKPVFFAASAIVLFKLAQWAIYSRITNLECSSSPDSYRSWAEWGFAPAQYCYGVKTLKSSPEDPSQNDHALFLIARAATQGLAVALKNLPCKSMQSHHFYQYFPEMDPFISFQGASPTTIDELEKACGDLYLKT